MGFFATFADKILGIDPPKPPPPLKIKQKQIVEVVVIGPKIEQAVAVGPGPSADAESIRILTDALVASTALRAQGQPRPINQIFLTSRAPQAFNGRRAAKVPQAPNGRLAAKVPQASNGRQAAKVPQASNGRQAAKVLQPAIRQISGESSGTGMAIALGFLLVLAALTLTKRRGR